MQISDRIGRARVSGTVKLAQQARDLEEAGKTIIELAEGEPEHDTPPHIIDAAFEAARRGETRYTAVAGTTELRDAVSKKFLRDNKITYGIDQIIIGTGAKQLIFNALLATLNPADEVIIPAPYWVSYPDIVKIADGTPVIVDCPAHQAFKITAGDLEKTITPNTRWLLLNSPCNPSGAVYSADELRALAEVLRRHPQVAIMCDDIYEKIVFDGDDFATMAEVAPDLFDRVLTINGVSKSYAMTGWRIGYAGGPADLVQAMTKLQGQSTTNPSSIGQAAALAALTGPQDLLNQWLTRYRSHRDLVARRITGIQGLSLQPPAGAFYHFINCEQIIGQRTPDGSILAADADIIEFLLHVAGVGLVPGSEFGAPGYLRLCFAKSESELTAACDLIEQAIGKLS
ncbi:MAG: aminotransferase class I/II-fold pyridoxal phosphate-dependent enzyme [Alphaproteobacteria bacterium]|nr:aminotransferase class I/II-fold pyridoxal phosphate-dependent enzyme [Alphaproteobacteria bacterium]